MPIRSTRPLVLTDEIRVMALSEIRDHSAPSAFRRLTHSLAARGYPLDLDPYLTTEEH